MWNARSCGSSDPTPVNSALVLTGGKWGDFGVVLNPKNLAAPRGFKGATNRRGVLTGLKSRSVPPLGLDNRFPLSVAAFPEHPPVAK